MPAREGGLVRFAARVEYDGTDFAGFQFQPGRRTVQGALEAALTTVSGDGRVRVSAAGRTDAGVHATGQVIAFTVRDMADERLARSMDTLLPADVGLRALWRVEAGWQPRTGGPVPSVPVHRLERAAQPAPRAHGARGATSRWTRPRWREPHWSWRAGTTSPPSADRPSTTDPDPPSGPGPQRGRRITIDVIGDAFLRQMVRSIAAALIRVGRGEATADDLRDARWRQRPRAFEGAVAPPHGLCLRRVGLGRPTRTGTDDD